MPATRSVSARRERGAASAAVFIFGCRDAIPPFSRIVAPPNPMRIGRGNDWPPYADPARKIAPQGPPITERLRQAGRNNRGAVEFVPARVFVIPSRSRVGPRVRCCTARGFVIRDEDGQEQSGRRRVRPSALFPLQSACVGPRVGYLQRGGFRGPARARNNSSGVEFVPARSAIPQKRVHRPLHRRQLVRGFVTRARVVSNPARGLSCDSRPARRGPISGA